MPPPPGSGAGRNATAIRGLLRAAASTALLASHAQAGALRPGSLGFSAPSPHGLLQPPTSSHRACNLRTSDARPQHAALHGERSIARRLTGPGACMSMSSDGFIKAGGSSDAAGQRETGAGKVQKSWPRVVWEFSRPHTIVGSVLSVVSLHLFAATAPGMELLNLSALGVALAQILKSYSL